MTTLPLELGGRGDRTALVWQERRAVLFLTGEHGLLPSCCSGEPEDGCEVLHPSGWTQAPETGGRRTGGPTKLDCF